MEQVIEKPKSRTFRIEIDNIDRMNRFVPLGSKTKFVNESLSKSLDEIEREKTKEEALEFLNNLNPIKVEGYGGSVAEVRKLREERDDHIQNIVESKH